MNNLELYKALVYASLLIRTKDEEEFAENLALSMCEDVCLFIDTVKYEKSRGVGKTSFFCHLARSLSKDKANKVLYVSLFDAQAKKARAMIKDETVDVIGPYDVKKETLIGKNYTHVIFDDVDINKYEKIKKDINKEAHVFGVITVNLNKRREK